MDPIWSGYFHPVYVDVHTGRVAAFDELPVQMDSWKGVPAGIDVHKMQELDLLQRYQPLGMLGKVGCEWSTLQVLHAALQSEHCEDYTHTPYIHWID